MMLSEYLEFVNPMAANCLIISPSNAFMSPRLTQRGILLPALSRIVLPIGRIRPAQRRKTF